MKNNIKTIEIQNFKSIKNLKLDCTKTNIFIGDPNVGKSNILEAMSLLGEHSGDTFYSDYIRYTKIMDLFYNFNLEKNIKIETGNKIIGVEPDSEGMYNYVEANPSNNSESRIHIASNGNIFVKPNSQLPIRSYKFLKKVDSISLKLNFLEPPFGRNIVDIFQNNKELKKLIQPLFTKSGFQIVIDLGEKIFRIQQILEGDIYLYPYKLIADTLQRIIFYLAAIKSNNDAIILFEEPETNSFPPYIKMIADNITTCENNQYFISTHSPYLLSTLLENEESDASVFIIYYEDHETKAHKLTDVEVGEVLNYGTDLFFNLDRYTGKANG